MNSSLLLVAVSATLAAVPVLAETTTAVWTNTNARVTTDYWGTVQAWTDGEGNPLAVAPTNAAANFAIKFSMVTTDKLNADDTTWLAGEKHVKQLSTGPNFGAGSSTTVFGGGAVEPVLDSIGANDPVNTHRYTIFNAPWASGYTFALARSFSVRDPNNFFGLLDSNNANCTWEFRAEPAFTPVAYGIHTAYDPHVRVPTSNTLAKVTGVSRSGGIVKDGAGTLEVMGGGSDSHYVVNGGALRLDGDGETEDALVENLFSEALLHLDASDDSTLVKSNAEGRVWLARWNDVRGNGVYAYPDPHDYESGYEGIISHPNPAFVSEQVSTTGLHLADFGVRASLASATDVSNCYMRISQDFNNVRDAVFVAAFPRGTQSATVLGHTSTYNWMSDGTYGRIFTCGYAPYAVAYGKFTVNGAPFTYDDLRAKPMDWTKVNVVHAQPTGDTSVNLLGTDRRYVSSHGNSRVGEILLFSRELTVAERAAIDRHLVAKWLDGKVRSAEGVLLKNGTSIDVAAGNIAHVDRVSAESGTVVKTGEGMLEVSDIVSEDQKFDVQGGSVRFASDPVVTSAPGGTPYLWLDATNDGTMTVGEKGVTSWKDCRTGTNLAATAVSATTGGTLATKTPADCNNLQTLNLGTGSSAGGSQSYMKLPNGTGDAYAGFMVVKFNNAAHYFMFGSSDMTFYRTTGKIGTGDATGVSAYVQREVTAAYWTINGIPRDTYTVYPELQQTTDYFVIGFKSAVPLTLNRIAVDRDDGNTCGNLRVGEFIMYRAPISAEEFRQTEAYLLNKWLNKESPANRATLKGMTFPAGQDMVINSDRDLTIGSLSGGNDKIVKKGAGKVTLIVSYLAERVPAVDILEGDIEIKFSSDIENETVLHIDASKLDTMTYEVAAGVTNVTYASDVKDASIQAHSVLGIDKRSADGSNVQTTHPVLKTVEVKSGVYRPVLDFFACRYEGHAQEANAGMQVEKNGVFSPVSNVREVFMIVAQNTRTQDGLKVNSWFTGSSTGDALRWGRNYYTADVPLIYYHATLTPKGFTNAVSASIDGVDGVATNMTFSPSRGFALIELRPGSGTPIGLIAMERFNYASGGYKFGEILAFPRELTASERAYLRAKLRAKWFEDTDMPGPAPVSFALTVGSTVDFEGDALAPTPITVNIPKDAEEGLYTLLTSENGFTTSDLAAWEAQLTVDNKSPKNSGIAIVGNSLVLRLSKRGFSILIR